MTNAEKFKEVFGIAIDDFYPVDPCDMVDHNICIEQTKGCNRCPLHNFWKKRYKKSKEADK